LGGSAVFCVVFIRKKHSKSGSTSIHIVRKEAGRQVHVMSIGTSTNDQELIEPERVALDKLSTRQFQSKFDFNFEEDYDFIKNL